MVEEQVRSDGDKSGQTDLSLAHVGQRLFEMLRRSRGMARGQLAKINKHKSEEVRMLQCDRKIRDQMQQIHKKTGSSEGPKPL